MDINVTVSDKRIAELLCTGFEGGMTGQWCRIMKTRKPKKVRFVLDEGRKDGKSWPFYDYPVIGGAVICRLDDGSADETDEKYTPLVLDRAAIDRGLKLMAQKYPKHWGDFMNENDDAVTGDVAIQCCLLGDLVYG